MRRSPVRVTIGMPVFDGERTLAMAIETLLAQTYADFQLLISDNASTDGTARICETFAARDPRVSYIRQRQNIGAEANFDFVLAQADSEYFMWAAADDSRSSDFVEANLDFLERHADFVGSTCRVRYVGEAYDAVRMGDATRQEELPSERIARFFEGWHANGRFYSLFRRRALVSAKEGIGAFLAADWAVVVRLLSQGKMNRLDAGSVDLGTGGASRSMNYLASQRKRWLHLLFPVAELTCVTLRATKGGGLAARTKLVLRLARFNASVLRTRFRFARDRVSQR